MTVTKATFIKGFKGHRIKLQKKGVWVDAMWTKARTCRWAMTSIRHQIRNKPALCADYGLLKTHVMGTALEPFCLKIQVLDTTEGIVYSISTKDFFTHGDEFHPPGWDRQWGCPLEYWTSERVNPEQSKMEMGVPAQRVEH